MADTPSRDWSRAAQAGRASLNAPPALAPLPGGRVALAWPIEISASDRALAFLVVDERGLPGPQRVLPLPFTFPHQPLLFPDAAGGLHLAWIDGDANAKQVYYARLDGAGQVLTARALVSVPDVEVTLLAGAPLADGGVALAWSDDDLAHPGAFLSLVERDGQVREVGRVLDPNGFSPAAALDGAGGLHLIWMRGASPDAQRIVYQPPQGAALEIASLQARAAPRLRLALDLTHASALWYQLVIRPGGVETNVIFLASTRLDSPRSGEARAIVLEHPGRAEFGEQPPGPPATYYQYPTTLTTQEYRAPIMLSADQPARRDQPSPAFEAVLDAGALADYRQLGASRGEAAGGTLARDDRGHLHAAWLQGLDGDTRIVWHASTAPDAEEFLAQRTRQDLREGAIWLLASVAVTLTSTVLFPFRAIPGLIALAVGSWLRVGGAGGIHAWRLLALAIAVQLPFNLLFGQFAGATGFLDDTLPHAQIAPFTTYILPLAGLLVGLAAVFVFRTVRPQSHPLMQFIVFAVADGWTTVLPFFVLVLREM